MRMLKMEKFIIAFLIFIPACSSSIKPTSDKCRELLFSDTATSEEIQNFIEKSNNYLNTLSEADSRLPENEGLGLCTGGLMKKINNKNKISGRKILE